MNSSPEHNPHDVAEQIAAILGETEPGPKRQVWRIVKMCGAEQALAWLAEAQALEAAGGMMLKDGSRRRTPGGAYFTLVRRTLRKTGRGGVARRIFFYDRGDGATPQPDEAPPAAPPAPAGPPPKWSERGAWITEAQETIGRATSVKVTIIGRPGRVVEKQGFVLFQITHEGTLQAMPKGLPVPSAIPATTYTVYVNTKQWRGVAEAIKAPDDALIIEGVQWYDQEYQTIVVMAMRTTTKLIQRATKQQAPETSSTGG